MHLAVKLCGEKLYGQLKMGQGELKSHKVFCSNMTFDATVNPVDYEGGAIYVGADIFNRGLCLPSDNKMTKMQQDIVIEIIHRCFR